MKDKDIASTLFKMHLNPKKVLHGIEYYRSPQFTGWLDYVGELDLSPERMIALAYPNYEIYAWFANGDLVEFSTIEGHLAAVGIVSNYLLQELEDEDSKWEELLDVAMPQAENIWGAPL